MPFTDYLSHIQQQGKRSPQKGDQGGSMKADSVKRFTEAVK
jgi:hypothetical protein